MLSAHLLLTFWCQCHGIKVLQRLHARKCYLVLTWNFKHVCAFLIKQVKFMILIQKCYDCLLYYKLWTYWFFSFTLLLLVIIHIPSPCKPHCHHSCQGTVQLVGLVKFFLLMFYLPFCEVRGHYSWIWICSKGEKVWLPVKYCNAKWIELVKH